MRLEDRVRREAGAAAGLGEELQENKVIICQIEILSLPPARRLRQLTPPGSRGSCSPRSTVLFRSVRCWPSSGFA